MQRSWTEAGMSLLEMLISGALVAGLSIAGMEIFKRQSEGAKYATVRSELDAYHNTLTKILSDFRNCNANFYPAMGSGSVTTASLSTASTIVQCCPTPGTNTNCTLAVNSCAVVTPAFTFAGNTRAVMTLNSGFNGDKRGFRPTAMGIFDSTGAAGISGATNIVKKGELRITYTLQSVTSGPPTIIKSIPITLKFTPAGFYSCADAELGTKHTLQRELCRGLDANLVTYNAATDKCERKVLTPTHTCPVGQVLIGLDSNGNSICNTSNNAFDKSQAINPANATGCNSTDNVELFWDSGTNKIRFKCL